MPLGTDVSPLDPGPNMQARLLPVDGGPPIDLGKDVVLVGRKESCDLQLDHRSVSKLHCLLVKTEGLVVLRDLGSTNGTRVNGQRVRRAILMPNDQVDIAHFKYRLWLGPDSQEPPAAVVDATQRLHVDDLAGPEDTPGAQGPGPCPAMPPEPVRPQALPDAYAESEASE